MRVGCQRELAVVNAINGDTVARYDYAPFGELEAESGDVNACPFRCQSKYYDVETGLSYFGFRYYSAKLGRWISRDPLEEEGWVQPVRVLRERSGEPVGLLQEKLRYLHSIGTPVRNMDGATAELWYRLLTR